MTIYKTPDGALIGQGLSATVDMQSVRPLDFRTQAVAVNYRREQLNKGLSTPSGTGYRPSTPPTSTSSPTAPSAWRWAWRACPETSGATQNFGSWGVNDVCPVPQDANNACPQATLGKAPGGFNDLVDKTEQTRDALMATLQYKPNKNLSSTLDLYYTQVRPVAARAGPADAAGAGPSPAGARPTAAPT